MSDPIDFPFAVVIPAKAGTHRAAARLAEMWIPAFPTDQLRGLKAHGMTIGAEFDDRP